MCHRLLCDIFAISVFFFCSELCVASDTVKPHHTLSGKWTSDWYETEWGPMREELELVDDGTYKMRNFMPEDKVGIIEFGNYSLKGNTIIFKDRGEDEQVIKAFRFDKKSRMFLRYENDKEVRYIRVRSFHMRKR